MNKTQINILLVDDDPPIRILLKRHLVRQGFNVRIAINGRNALDILEDFHPQMIISDIMMPIMDGFELCRIIRKDRGPVYRTIPFIFLTAKSAPSAIIEGFRHGADDYIVKPFDIADVLLRVRVLADKITLSDTIEDSTAFSGDIAEISLPDILQILEVGRKTGSLQLELEEGRTGSIAFSEGFIAGAHYENKSGEDAVIDILSLNKGHFSFKVCNSIKHEMEPVKTINLLIEGMRLIDELSRIANYLPASDTIMEIKPINGSEQTKRIIDTDIDKIALMLESKELLFSDLLKSSPVSSVRTSVAVGIMIAKDLISLRSTRTIQSLPAEKPASEKLVKTIVVAGVKKSPDYFIETAMRRLALNGVRKTEGIGLSTHYMFPLTDSRIIKVYSARAEARFSDFMPEHLKDADLAVYFSDGSGEFDSRMKSIEQFLQLVGTREKIVVAKRGDDNAFIRTIANPFNCQCFEYGDGGEMASLFGSLLLDDSPAH